MSSGGGGSAFWKYFFIVLVLSTVAVLLFVNRQKINSMVNSKFMALAESRKEKPAVGYKKKDREELKNLLNKIQ